MDVQQVYSSFIDELNEAVESRAFVPFAQKWFVPDGALHLYYDTTGIEPARKLWQHIVPTGEDPTRKVSQYPYKFEGTRVYSYRALEAAQLPKPAYGLQETEFSERMLISDMVIQAVEDKPDVQPDPALEKTRLGRIFHAFEEAFNDYFNDGNPDHVMDWCEPDVHIHIEHEFHGMGTMSHLARYVPGLKFEIQDWEKAENGEGTALMRYSTPDGFQVNTITNVWITPRGTMARWQILPQMQ
jgi:hypothetical protein